MKKISWILGASLAIAGCLASSSAIAQADNNKSGQSSSQQAKDQKAKEPLVTIDLKEAPARSAFEMLFKSAKVKNYVIDNTVTGFITISLEEQPLDSAIRYMLLANTMPLTMIKDNNVYIIKRRTSDQAPRDAANNPPPSPPLPETKQDRDTNVTWEKIHLNFIDPLDLQILFGPILNIQQFSRFRGGMGGGMGMGGFQGGMMGGMGMGGFNGMGGMGMMGGAGGVGGGPGMRN